MQLHDSRMSNSKLRNVPLVLSLNTDASKKVLQDIQKAYNGKWPEPKRSKDLRISRAGGFIN